MRSVLKQLFLLLLLLSADARPAPADLVLDLRYSDLTKSKTVTSGQSVFIDLLITDNDESTPLKAEGLLTGGGRLVRTLGNISFAPGIVTNTAGWVDAFDLSPVSSGAGVEIAKVFGSTDFLLGPAVGTALTSVVIATFELVATGANGSTATLTADVLNAISANATFDTFYDLDADPSMTFGSVDLMISGSVAVPEPASMVLGALTGLFAGAMVRRRRQQSRKDADTSCCLTE